MVRPPGTHRQCRYGERVKQIMGLILLVVVFSSFTFVGILVACFLVSTVFYLPGYCVSKYPTTFFKMYFRVGMFPTSRDFDFDVLRR